MEKTTIKELKRIAKYDRFAKDITYLSFDDANRLIDKENGLTVQMVSVGIYGLNGALLKGNKTQNTYVITARSSTLAQLV